eukprot:TRINITY_DN1006_c0_g1_i14.p1 TRINITY_DN1006_c0_g1~~TRINITY_DN1006_c0_g1_i14.p1  ORF type:complete len:231 (+),score=65.23 TRINITY_DN1006_c0_g1_i14:666-1358(+)
MNSPGADNDSLLRALDTCDDGRTFEKTQTDFINNGEELSTDIPKTISLAGAIHYDTGHIAEENLQLKEENDSLKRKLEIAEGELIELKLRLADHKHLDALKEELESKEETINELNIKLEECKRGRLAAEFEAKEKEKQIDRLLEENITLNETSEGNDKLMAANTKLNAQNIELIKKVNMLVREIKDIKQDVLQYKDVQTKKNGKLQPKQSHHRPEIKNKRIGRQTTYLQL